MIFTFIFLVTVVIRLWIWLRYFNKFTDTKSDSLDQLLPAISVIVVAKNEKQGLQKLLPAIFSQNYPDFEVIVVDDFSNDGSVAYLNSVTNDKLIIVSCDQDLPGKKYALSRGINVAKNDAILLIDGDCWPAGANWILKMGQKFQANKKIVLGVGLVEKEGNITTILSRYDAINTAIQYVTAANINEPYMGVGRNLLYSKALYLKANGYQSHENFISGDDDLQVQAMANSFNTVAILDNESFTYTKSKTDLTSWIMQKVRHISVATAYLPTIKIKLIVLAASHMGFYFSGVVSLFYFPLTTIVTAIFFYLMVLPINLRNYKVLEEEKLAYFFPVADATFAFLHPLIFLISKINSKRSWKK